jgi:tetratricopeptide (TPR) repeat protein
VPHRPLRIVVASTLARLLLVGVLLAQEPLLEAIQARLAANPKDPAARQELGVAYLRRGDYPDAYIELQKAIAVAPNPGMAHYFLALVYFEKGLYFKEIEQYHEAIKTLPDFVPAHLNLAHACLAVGRIPDAIEQYEWVRRRDPKNLTVLYNLGIVFADLNRPAEASRYLTEYSRLAPQDHPGRARAAQVLAEVRDHR